MPTGRYIIEVERGAPLPRVGGEIVRTSPLTGLTYVIHVTSISKLAWRDDGDLEIVVRGYRRLVSLPTDDDDEETEDIV